MRAGSEVEQRVRVLNKNILYNLVAAGGFLLADVVYDALIGIPSGVNKMALGDPVDLALVGSALMNVLAGGMRIPVVDRLTESIDANAMKSPTLSH